MMTMKLYARSRQAIHSVKRAKPLENNNVIEAEKYMTSGNKNLQNAHTYTHNAGIVHI